MIISLKDLIRESSQNNKSWLETTNVKNRIKNVIKKEKLPIDVVEFLWQKRELRWDIVKYQVLSDDMMKFVIDNFDNKKEISRPIYKEMLISQKISDDVLDYLGSVARSQELVLEAWKNIPERMHQKFDIKNFYSFLELEGTYNNFAYIQTIVLISKKKMFLSMLLDYIIDKELSELVQLMGGKFLETLCTGVFFDDDSIDKLSKILTPELFKKHTEYIISRGNCSKASKALLLLFR